MKYLQLDKKRSVNMQGERQLLIKDDVSNQQLVEKYGFTLYCEGLLAKETPSGKLHIIDKRIYFEPDDECLSYVYEALVIIYELTKDNLLEIKKE
jgi:hypothetical protein